MRGVGVGVVLAAIGGAACFGRNLPESTSTTTVTSAATTPSGEVVSDRIARTVCVHEVECGRVRDPSLCVDASRMRTARELSSWTCDADSARVAAEQCLFGLRGEPCSVDLSARPNICAKNGGCATIEGDPAAAR